MGWVARAATVLSTLRKKGFVGGIRSGRLAHSVLQNKEELLDEWLKVYKFERNETYLYYSARENVLSHLKNYFVSKKQERAYALTLHTGANFITHYVNTPTMYCYFSKSYGIYSQKYWTNKTNYRGITSQIERIFLFMPVILL